MLCCCTNAQPDASLNPDSCSCKICLIPVVQRSRPHMCWLFRLQIFIDLGLCENSVYPLNRMVNIMLNNCNHYAPIEIAMVYPLLRHTQKSYQVGELYNIYIQHIPCLQMIVQLSPITNYKHPFTTAYNTNCFPASSCQVCIQYYSMISSWLVKLNCIPIYMLSCELTQMWKSTVYIYIYTHNFPNRLPNGFSTFS